MPTFPERADAVEAIRPCHPRSGILWLVFLVQLPLNGILKQIQQQNQPSFAGPMPFSPPIVYGNLAGFSKALP